MASSISYKTFYADNPADVAQWPLTGWGTSSGQSYPRVDSGLTTENSSEGISFGQGTNLGSHGFAYITKDLFTVAANTVWSLEKFNIVFDRDYQIVNPFVAAHLVGATQNRYVKLNYNTPNSNFDQFSLVLVRGGTTEVPLITDYLIQPTNIGLEIAWVYNSAPTTKLWTTSLSLAERAPITNIPSRPPLIASVNYYPNLYNVNFEAGDILQFKYKFAYTPVEGNTGLNTATSVRYTPKYHIYMSGIENVTA